MFSGPVIARSQTNATVFGIISDSNDSSAVPFTSVILYQYGTNNILTYSQSGENGQYKINLKPQAGIYTLTTSRLGYEKHSQNLVFVDSTASEIRVDISLIPKATKLDEVTIRSVTAPVIIKEDTIIYDIAHWSKETDRSLEDVLIKLPGFEVLNNGEIKVNGRNVDKVVIDGAEVADLGAAMITKSLSPEDVENIEVRFDEKDDKLKESILDTDRYVVLDIKLKKDLNKAFFGKARLSSGYQQELKPGAYTNLFSLKKRMNLQLFAERDLLGAETIALWQIRNLGDESVQQMFDIPADFQQVESSQGYHENLYGVKDFLTDENTIMGLSGMLNLSEDLSLYMGSFNGVYRDAAEQALTQIYLDTMHADHFVRHTNKGSLTSKNKLELKYDKPQLKARVNINGIFSKEDHLNDSYLYGSDQFYDFSEEATRTEWHQNAFLEYKISERIGLRIKNTWSSEIDNRQKVLHHQDTSYFRLLADAQGNGVTDFVQEGVARQQRFIGEMIGQYKLKTSFTFKLGAKYHHRNLTIDRLGYNKDTDRLIDEFTSGEAALRSQTWSPLAEAFWRNHSFFVGVDGQYHFIQYPDRFAQHSTTSLPGYKMRVGYEPGNYDHITISWSSGLAPFPLRALVPGYELISFQQVAESGAHRFSPKAKQLLEISSAKYLQGLDLLIDYTMLRGLSPTGSRFILGSYPFIEMHYDQLNTWYWMHSLAFTWGTGAPVKVVLEPERLTNTSLSRDTEGNPYETSTDRLLLGLKVESNFQGSLYNFFWHSTFHSFSQFSELNAEQTSLGILSFSLRNDFSLNNGLLLVPAARAVRFFEDSQTAYFFNLGFTVQWSVKNWRFLLSGDNLFDNRRFVMQTANPFYFQTSESAVFPRYIKAGVEFKFK